MLGLGCEINQIGGLMTEQKLAGRLRDHGNPGNGRHPQNRGGRRRLRARGAERCQQRAARDGAGQRTDGGLQCGGSDGYSGISANPALGAASDLLVRHGGTVILSETPETYGAEHLLTRRAVSREVGEKLVG